MKIIHSFTMRVLMIMVSLLLLFCAVSTIAWYRSFTQEAVETAEEHMDTVIETLNECLMKNCGRLIIQLRLFQIKSGQRRMTVLFSS